MSKPVAKVGDMHTCPMTTGPVPHVGGPIVGPGATTVLVDNMPVAVVSDAATCSGPPDVIISGSTTVLAENKPLAALGSQTAHGGVVVAGSPTVLVGDVPSPPQTQVLQTDQPVCEECEEGSEGSGGESSSG